MINKIYKRIHSKYLRVFNLFFFLKYVFIIFFIAITLFLSAPKFFNYDKKEEIIKKYLNDFYYLEINDISKIKYKIFPLPNLSIQNSNFNIKNKPINLKSNNIIIYMRYKNIHNYKNFRAKKIVFQQSEMFVEVNKAKELIKYFKEIKSNYDFKNLNIKLEKNNKSLITIKNINFSNYGYKKYKFNGEMFDKKFKASLKKEGQIINFNLLDTGIKVNLELNKQNLYSGSSKISLSNNLLKFDFNLKNNFLEITRSNFRNKSLSFSLDSLIKFNPFFYTDSNIVINEIDKNIIEYISLEKIIKNREIIKKLNSNIITTYKSKKYFNGFIENYSSDLKLAYGRVNFTNKIFFLDNEINCKSDSVLTAEYPQINFNCLLNLNDSKKFLKKFSISTKLKKDPININIEGTLNLFNKKINFKKIKIDNHYLANEEEVKYFKDSFENILFDESFFQIFKKDKIKKFLLEII